MQFSTRQVMIMLGGVIMVGLLVFLIATNIKPASPELGGGRDRTELLVWGVDSPSVFSQINQNYQKARQDVNIKYRQFREETFEDELLSALAAGIGPDVIMVKNRTLARLQNKLLPLTSSQFSLNRFRKLYPTVAEQDFVVSGSGLTYALPLYIDTMAFLYDRDAFDQAGVLTFPETWEKLSQDVPKLRGLSSNGQLTKSAVAIGGTNRTSINGPDLLLLLMLQSGVDFSSGARTDNAARQAFDFYLQFSNPASPFYSWNETFGSSFDAFISNRTSIIPIYYGQLSTLLRKDPFLRYQVAPMAQINPEQPIHYADYWGLAVVRQTKNSAEAWQYAQYVTTLEPNAALYAENTNRPPALKTLLERNFSDPVKGVFARQALTARSWPGPNDFSVRQIISNNIAAFLRGEVQMSTALETIGLQLKQLQALR